MAKVFIHTDEIVDQEFQVLATDIDKLLDTNAGLNEITATPGGPAATIPKTTTQAWTVGMSLVGGADTIS